MDIQDQSKITTPSGHTELIGSGVISDDDHHPDEDTVKTPSAKIEKKSLKESDGGGIVGRSTRSEDDFFSDAVTEFSETGISPGVVGNGGSDKTLDKDIFLSFKDADNSGTNELFDSPIESTKTDDNLEVFVTPDTNPKDPEKLKENEVSIVCDSTEGNPKASDSLVKDEVLKSTPNDGFNEVKVQTQADSAIDVDVNGEKEKEVTEYVLNVPSDILEADQSETLIEDFKDHEALYRKFPVILGDDGDKDTVNADSMVDTSVVKKGDEEIQESQTFKEGEKIQESQTFKNEEPSSKEPINFENTEMQLEAVAPTVITTPESSQDKLQESQPLLMSETSPQSMDSLVETKVISTTGLIEEKLTDNISDMGADKIKQEKVESDHENAVKKVKELEIEEEKLTVEISDMAVGKIEHEKLESDHENAPEKVKELEIEKEKLTDKNYDVAFGKIDQEKLESDHENAPEKVEKLEIEEKKLIDKISDMGVGKIEQEKHESDHENAPEKVKELEIEEEKLTDKISDVGVGKIEQEKLESDHKNAPEKVKELEIDHNVPILTEDRVKEPHIVDESEQKMVERVAFDSKDGVAFDSSAAMDDTDNKNNGKLMTNQDGGVDMSVDSSSHNSLEGNWGSVSVLSTASIDAETYSIEKSKVNVDKSETAVDKSISSDVLEAPSLMTPVETKGEVDQKEASAAVDSQPKSKLENEDVIAKVTNWSTGEHIAPLKNLLVQAKSPDDLKQMSNEVAEKNIENANVELTKKSTLTSEAPVVNQESSPPKYIDEEKKVRKKRASWVPFMCCSSVNVN